MGDANIENARHVLGYRTRGLRQVRATTRYCKEHSLIYRMEPVIVLRRHYPDSDWMPTEPVPAGVMFETYIAGTKSQLEAFTRWHGERFPTTRLLARFYTQAELSGRRQTAQLD